MVGRGGPASPRLFYVIERSACDRDVRSIFAAPLPSGGMMTTDLRVPGSDGKGTTPLSLLERARARDADAWGRLVALYRPLILYWCRRRGVSGDDVEDVAQEVLAAVSRGLDGFR